MACFAAYAIFGINIITCKDLTSSNIFSPIALFCIRSSSAALIFWIISAFMPCEKVDKKDYLKILAASFLGFFLTQMTFLIAIPDISPMNCAIVSSMSPVYTMFIAAFALKEPITAKKAGGVLLSLAGIIWLIMSSGNPSEGTSTNIRGFLLMVGNSLSFSLYLGLFKPVIKKYSVVTFMKWIFLFATMMSLPLAFSDIINAEFSRMTPRLGFDLTFLVVGATFIAYFLIPFGQKRIRPTLVSLYSYAQPIIATSISIIIGMDMLTWQKAAAALAVIIGVLLVNFSRSAQGN